MRPIAAHFPPRSVARLAVNVLLAAWALLPAAPHASASSFQSTLMARDWLVTPHDLALDADGHLLVAANLDNRVAVVSPAGELLRYYELDDYQGAFQNTSVATTASGRSWALNNLGLYELLPDGRAVRIMPLSNSRYGFMTHMCAGQGEVLYFTTDRGQGALFEIQITPSVSIRQIASLPAGSLRALDRGPDGNLYALSNPTGEIYRITPGGEVSLFHKGLARTGGPYYIAFSPRGTLFVSDSMGSRTTYEITLAGDVTRRQEYLPCSGSILFLPDGKMYGLEIYEPQLVLYDLDGRRRTLLTGTAGRQLCYLPSGSVLGRTSGRGRFEYFASGTVVPSPLTPSLNNSASYLFDLDGNIYWFLNRRLSSVQVDGGISVLAEGLPEAYASGIRLAAINFRERAVYAVGCQDDAAAILRHSLLDGTQKEIWSSPGPLVPNAVAVTIDGVVYHSYQTLSDFGYHVVRIPPDGPAAEIFNYPGRERGMILTACSPIEPRCYFVVGPEPFRLREISAEGAVSDAAVTGDSVRAVDYSSLAVTPGGDVWLAVPGQVYRLASRPPASPPVPAEFATVELAPEQSTEVAIPGEGLDSETAVEISVPGIWVYQKSAGGGVLRFRISAWPLTAPGEYDLVLHNAGCAPVVLPKKIRILPKL